MYPDVKLHVAKAAAAYEDAERALSPEAKATFLETAEDYVRLIQCGGSEVSSGILKRRAKAAAAKTIPTS